MKRYLILNRVCILTSLICLSAAYILAGYWQILFAFVTMILFWITLKRWSVFRSSSALLSMFMILSAVGITIDLSLPLILIACTAALASWDLTSFAQEFDNQRSDSSLRLESAHLRSLATASSVGLVLVFIGSYNNFHLPFGVTLLLALIAIGCLNYGWQMLARNH